MQRRVMQLRQGFFNDGPSYMLTSTGLGGLSPQDLASRLQGNAEDVRQVLRDGICIPLHFDGDCALDDAVIVVGDLTPQEEAEWIGRIRAWLHIPCGEFVLLGGGLEEDFESAVQNPEADPSFINFCKFTVDPGKYLVEIFAFVASMSVNVAWDGMGMHPWTQSKEAIAAWWETTRGGQPHAPWVEAFLNGYAASDALQTLSYLIRLAPLQEEVPLPPLDNASNWCGIFEWRKPALCPLGIRRAALE